MSNKWSCICLHHFLQIPTWIHLHHLGTNLFQLHLHSWSWFLLKHSKKLELRLPPILSWILKTIFNFFFKLKLCRLTPDTVFFFGLGSLHAICCVLLKYYLTGKQQWLTELDYLETDLRWVGTADHSTLFNICIPAGRVGTTWSSTPSAFCTWGWAAGKEYSLLCWPYQLVRGPLSLLDSIDFSFVFMLLKRWVEQHDRVKGCLKLILSLNHRTAE